MPCQFIMQMSKLRKSSAEAVDNTQSFDSSKKYLHIERPVETELRNLLRRVNTAGSKRLILLCGSAGDGKSHLISYLKHADSECLLDGYELYNDATESASPTLTAIDTLAEKLAPFNDDNYLIDDGYKMIIAINLGMLNNFIDSEKGNKYTILRKYIESNDLFTYTYTKATFCVDSVFQHVNFSDYQIFSLSKNGIVTTYIEELFAKVFQSTDNNPFYQAYKESITCSLCKQCPVRHNYEFLQNKSNQDYLIRRIVEIILKDKAVVSTREILNLLYGLIVHPDFDEGEFCDIILFPVKYLEYYLRFSTPMILNNGSDISPVLDHMIKHDPLKTRNEHIDSAATRFHSLEVIGPEFDKATENTPYSVLTKMTGLSNLGADKPDLKRTVYQFIARIEDFFKDPRPSDRFNEYIHYLYCQNTRKTRGLRELYAATKNAVFKWNGEFGDEFICIDDTNDYYWVLERLHIKPKIVSIDAQDNVEIQRFSPSLKLRFSKDPDLEESYVEIDIDYSLFEIIMAMKEGYRPTWQDKNLHTDFVNFIQKIIDLGEKNSSIIILPKNGESTQKYIFSEDDFGAAFKEVKL